MRVDRATGGHRCRRRKCRTEAVVGLVRSGRVEWLCQPHFELALQAVGRAVRTALEVSRKEIR